MEWVGAGNSRAGGKDREIKWMWQIIYDWGGDVEGADNSLVTGNLWGKVQITHEVNLSDEGADNCKGEVRDI